MNDNGKRPERKRVVLGAEPETPQQRRRRERNLDKLLRDQYGDAAVDTPTPGE